MKITLLYQVSHYIRVKKQRNIKSWDQQNYLVIRGFCYIRPLYNEVPLYIHNSWHPPQITSWKQQLVGHWIDIGRQMMNILKWLIFGVYEETS